MTSVIKSIEPLRKLLNKKRKEGKTIGFVPTMGALHEGHLSLVKKCLRENDITVISIFVNPLQFGPNEDYKSYPRNHKQDLQLAKKAGVDIVFIPKVETLYPKEILTTIKISELNKHLCGKSRPDHFEGVLTVVGKLFNIILPATAYFGQKDIQQAIIIKKFVEDLNFSVKIKICPTVREKDGLALSSRNKYLSSAHRKEAAVLYSALKEAKKKISSGKYNLRQIIKMIEMKIINDTSGKIDYIECIDLEKLSPVKTMNKSFLIAVAVKFDNARLIDNIIINAR